MSEFRNIHSFHEHKGAVYALCQGGEAHTLFSAGADRRVISWDLNEMKVDKVVAKSPTTVISLLYIKQHDFLLIGQVEGGVHVIDLNKKKEVKHLKGHAGYIFDMEYLRDKQELVVASGDGSFSVWSVPDFKRLLLQKVGNGKVREIDYSEKRDEIAIASGVGKVQIRNSKDYTLKMEWEGFKSAVNVVRFSPNEDALLVGEKDALLTRIDLVTNHKSKPIPAHYWAIYDIRFSPDGKLMATASRDKTIKIWDSDKLKVLKRLEGTKDEAHFHSVNKLLWFQFRNYLLSTGDDGCIKVWSAND